MGLDEKSWNNVKQQCLNNVFTLFHYAKKHWLHALKCVESYSIFIGLLSNLFKCYINILKCLHINTTYTFNIKFVYESYEYQNQGPITKTIAFICMVLPSSFFNWKLEKKLNIPTKIK